MVLTAFWKSVKGCLGRFLKTRCMESYRVNITNLARDGGLFLVTGTVKERKLQKFTNAIVP